MTWRCAVSSHGSSASHLQREALEESPRISVNARSRRSTVPGHALHAFDAPAREPEGYEIVELVHGAALRGANGMNFGPDGSLFVAAAAGG
jgi:uncharacterized protein involved in type VI secretion and phage assembly